MALDDVSGGMPHSPPSNSQGAHGAAQSDFWADTGFRSPSMRALALHASERPMSGTGTTPDSSTMTTDVVPFASTTRTLERKATPEELEDYRRFVLNLADKVAAAHREGGQSISPAEGAAIEEIAAALGTAGP